MPPVSVGHYENFPVASVLCPPRLRPAIRAIYAFARTADDIADEGSASPDQRRADLARYRQALVETAGTGPMPSAAGWPGVFEPLRKQLHAHALPLPLLDDLLDAFVQDAGNPIYEQRTQLLDYCRRSANPVGRLLLHLYGIGDATSLAQSDQICSALQLINFWQDLSVDLPRGRHYVPRDDAARHGLAPEQLPALADNPASRALVKDLTDWAAQLMAAGAPLATRVPGRVGWELRLVVQGGWRILEKIAAMDHATLRHRPRLHATDLPLLLWRALRMNRRPPDPRALCRPGPQARG